MSTADLPQQLSELEKGDLSSASASVDAALPGRKIRGPKWFLLVCAVLSSMFIYSLDGTITADLVPSIVNEFDAVPLLSWLSVGFMVGSIVTVFPLGKLYGTFDAKWLYVISVVIFLAASALCGAAPNMSAMIVGRVLLGMSGNGIYFGILTLLSVYTDEKERPAYLSLVGLVWGIGTVLGPVVGGAFDKITWRWAFYINLIIGGVFAPVYLFLLPSFDPLPKGTPFKARASKFDFLGAFLSIGGILFLVLAINYGGAVYPWNSAEVIVFFVIGGLLLLAFGVQQHFAWLTSTTDRMFPCHFLKSKEAILLFIAAAGINAAGFIPVYYIPIYFQFSRGDSALDAAVRLLPLIIVLSVAILTNGFLMSRLGYYQPWYVAGATLALIGDVLLSRIDEHTNTANIYGYKVLVGLGSGMFIQAGYATIQTVVAPVDTSYAIAFMMLAQFCGIVFGLSVSAAVFVNKAIIALTAFLPSLPASEIHSIISGTSSAALENLSVEMRTKAISIIVKSLVQLFISAYAAAAIALVASIFLQRRKAFHTKIIAV